MKTTNKPLIVKRFWTADRRRTLRQAYMNIYTSQEYALSLIQAADRDEPGQEELKEAHKLLDVALLKLRWIYLCTAPIKKK